MAGATELRSRAQLWSSPMAQKITVPKSVLVAMEVLEKKLMDSMEAQELRLTDKMNDIFEKFVAKMDKMTTDIKDSFSAEVKAITNEIEAIKKNFRTRPIRLNKLKEKQMR